MGVGWREAHSSSSHTQTPAPRVPDVNPCRTSSKLWQLVWQRWPGPHQPMPQGSSPNPRLSNCDNLGPSGLCPLRGLGAGRAGEEHGASRPALPCQPLPTRHASSRLLPTSCQLLGPPAQSSYKDIFNFFPFFFFFEKYMWQREQHSSSLGTDWEMI